MSSTLENIKELSQLTDKLLKDTASIQLIDEISDVIVKAYQQENKTIFVGMEEVLPKHNTLPPNSRESSTSNAKQFRQKLAM